jgi:hypothetical protein
MRRANFEIRPGPYAGSVLLADIGPWDQYPTITNDIDNVVKSLYANGVINGSVLLFYTDSNGDTDQIIHDDGEFIGFAPYRADAED